MALFSLFMALLSFYHLAQLALAGFPTQVQEYVDIFKKNFLKSSCIIWQRNVRDLQPLYQEHALFYFQVKHGQCLSVLLMAAQLLFAYGVGSSPGSQNAMPCPKSLLVSYNIQILLDPSHGF